MYWSHPTESALPDPDGSTTVAASVRPLPEEVIELIVEAVASPAAAGTLKWIPATAEARVELDAVREVVDGDAGGLDK